MIKCIAIDDEPLALQVVTEYALRIPFLSLLQTFTNTDEAINYLQKNEVDLLLLDIQMPDISGLQLYRSLEKKPLVIFTTAFSQYAVEGFNVDAIDYLLKPFEFDRFLKAVYKAKEYIEFLSNQEMKMASIFVKVDYQLMKINLKDIELIEGLDDYIRIHLKPRPVLTLMTLKSLQEKLPPTEFVRLHRSYIVPVSKIESYGKNKLRVSGREIPVGSSYSTAYQQLLRSRQIDM